MIDVNTIYIDGLVQDCRISSIVSNGDTATAVLH